MSYLFLVRSLAVILKESSSPRNGLAPAGIGCVQPFTLVDTIP